MQDKTTVLERRLQELGRIRIGDQVPLSGKKEGTRPRRLTEFRLTSQNKPRLHFAASLYGGEVTEWVNAPQGKQWQLYTTVDTLPVVVPPFAALHQQNEIWQGGECRLRCNGEVITFSTKPEKINEECFCARMTMEERKAKAAEGLACHTITRLSLILPDLPGIGVWRFETSSYYAGMELQGGATLLEQASAEGVYIECSLQIEERRVRRRDSKGNVQTQVFPIVTLQPNVSMRQLMQRDIPPEVLVSGTQRPQLSQATRTAELYGVPPQGAWGQHSPTEETIPLPETGRTLPVRERLHFLVDDGMEKVRDIRESTADEDLPEAVVALEEACRHGAELASNLTARDELLDAKAHAIAGLLEKLGPALTIQEG